MMLLLSTLALAATPVDERVAADKDVAVTIELVCGEITVTGTGGKEVHVTGHVDDATQLAVASTGGGVGVVVEQQRRLRGGCDTDLDVSVPRDARVFVDSVSAVVEVREVATATVDTVSGNITIDGIDQQVNVESVSGVLLVRGAPAQVAAITVSGAVQVEGGPLDRLHAESVSGSVAFDGAFTKQGRIELESHSGAVVLVLPRGIDADFDIETFSGRIDNQLTGTAAARSMFGGGELRFQSGHGGAHVDVATFSGKVEIKPR